MLEKRGTYNVSYNHKVYTPTMIAKKNWPNWSKRAELMGAYVAEVN